MVEARLGLYLELLKVEHRGPVAFWINFVSSYASNASELRGPLGQLSVWAKEEGPRVSACDGSLWLKLVGMEKLSGRVAEPRTTTLGEKMKPLGFRVCGGKTKNGFGSRV